MTDIRNFNKLTPKQQQNVLKNLDKTYRETKYQRKGTLQQRQLNRTYSKPSGQSAAIEGKLRGSRSIIKKSQYSQIHRQNIKTLRGYAVKTKAAVKNAKPAAANNISKFGGGLKARFAPSLKILSNGTAAAGLKTKTLGTTLTKSKFVAGAKGGPVALLGLAAYLLWEKNIDTLKGIYDIGERKTIPSEPLGRLPPSPPLQFTGGQDYGVIYEIRIDFTSLVAGNVSNGFVVTRQPGYTVVQSSGQLGGVTLEQGEYPDDDKVFWVVRYKPSEDSPQLESVDPAGSVSAEIELVGVTVARADGLPDTSTRDELRLSEEDVRRIADAIYSDNRNRKTNVRSKPSGQAKLDLPSEQKYQGSSPLPIPSVIPVPTLPPGGYPVTEPRSPFDSPRIVESTPPEPAKKQKPKNVAKRTYYPDSLPFELPGSEVIKNNQTGVDTVIRRKYRTDPKIPESATEVKTEIDRDSIPDFYFPRLVERQPKRTPAPKATPTNPCKRGCGGGGSSTSFAPGSSSSKNLAGLMNDLLLQNPLLKKIDATTTATKGAVFSDSFGLEKIQNFATTAWKQTRADKILNYLSMAATLHNAAMLSRNLGASLGDTVSAIANNTISTIKNEESNPIDINATLGKSLESFISGIIGAENYTQLGQTFKEYSVIVNAASNVIYNINSVMAGVAQGLETIGNYTGKIGNSLKKGGAVLENSYQWMSEKVTVKTGRLGQIQSLIDGGEQVEEFVSQIEYTTSEFREAQENINSIGQEFDVIRTAFEDEEKDRNDREKLTKTSSLGTSPDLIDLEPDPITP